MYAKKRLNRASPCMYPIEYRWISVPTPVTNRIIVDESGSTRKRKSTRKPRDLDPREPVADLMALFGLEREQREERDARRDERQRT